MKRHRGHCRCESLVVLIDSEPEVSVYCHCDDCCRATGAPVIAAVGMPRGKISWTGSSSLGSWAQGTCTRTFCKRCGTPVAQEHESAPDLVFFYTAFLDEPQKFPPTYHSFEGQQLGWLALRDNLPRYERTKIIEATS